MIPASSSSDAGAPARIVAPVQSVRLPIPAYSPLWTFVLLGINAVVWLAMTVSGGSENPLVLVRFGAKYGPLIAHGQYWRLLTACFLHIGIIHLAFNAYALFSFGVDIERRFGRVRFLALYLLAGIGGTVFSFVASDTLSAGASGAIFGLLGAAIAYFVVYRKRFGPHGRRQLIRMLIVAGYNLVWGLAMPGIDNLGHIGGLLTGLALGWAYTPTYALSASDETEHGLELVSRFRQKRAWLASAGVAVVLGLLTVLGVWLRG